MFSPRQLTLYDDIVVVARWIKVRICLGSEDSTVVTMDYDDAIFFIYIIYFPTVLYLELPNCQQFRHIRISLFLPFSVHLNSFNEKRA